MPQQTLATQQFVEIQEIKDGVIHLKSGGLRRLLMVAGVNFDLKSVEEQSAILRAFQNFLNALDFSVQFFVHSRKVNIAPYLEKMAARRTEEQNELLRIQIDDYIEFVRSFVEQNPIITKTFFVVVGYDTAPAAAQAAGGLLGFFKKGGGGQAQTSREIELQKSLLQLNQRVDEVVAGLENIGLQTNQLDDEAATELFYNLYNPQLIEKQGMEILQKQA